MVLQQQVHANSLQVHEDTFPVTTSPRRLDFTLGFAFRIFHEDLTDDDWVAETFVNVAELEIKKEIPMWLDLDPKGKMFVKIDLYRPMKDSEIQTRQLDDKLEEKGLTH